MLAANISGYKITLLFFLFLFYFICSISLPIISLKKYFSTFHSLTSTALFIAKMFSLFTSAEFLQITQERHGCFVPSVERLKAGSI